jgi:hypothetical protein
MTKGEKIALLTRALRKNVKALVKGSIMTKAGRITTSNNQPNKNTINKIRRSLGSLFEKSTNQI